MTVKKTRRNHNSKGVGRGRYRRGSTTLDEAAIQTFLSVLMEGWSPTKAAEAAEKPRATFYKLRETSESFRLSWDAAEAAGTDRLEDIARSRASEGWDKPLVHQGKVTGDSVKEIDNTLLMFLLNGRRPEKFRQNVKVDAPDLARAMAAGMANALKAHGTSGGPK